MSASQIVVTGVNKVFKSDEREVVALKDINLDIPDGQFVCLLGPSGCGKSTLLNAIAGFALPSSGSITTDGKLVTEPGPDRGMVFQEYALFPWMTVEQNVAFGLEIKGVGKAEIHTRVTQLLDKLGIRQQMEGKAAQIPATPVGEIIAHGEADFGCQQRSELKPVQGIDVVGVLPAEVQLKTEFSGAVVRGARNPESARALLRFLAAPANAAAIEATGLEPVAATH